MVLESLWILLKPWTLLIMCVGFFMQIIRRKDGKTSKNKYKGIIKTLIKVKNKLVGKLDNCKHHKLKNK